MIAVWLESWAGFLLRRFASLLIGPCCVERLCGRVALPGAARCHRHEGELALEAVVRPWLLDLGREVPQGYRGDGPLER